MDIFAIIKLLGGLAMFLYGIEIMGDGLKNSSGAALKKVLEKVTGNVLVGVLTGTLVTAVIQSSTATIVLTVALIGAGVLSLRQAVSIVLGANIGTTITALLAATAISGAGAQLALTIALVHVLFNLFAVVLIYGVPFLRELPIKAAEALARVGSENKLLALGYVAGLFFALPALMMVAAK